MKGWRKIQHIFVADKQSDWMYSHASNPVLSHMEGTEASIYFSCRDKEGKSHIAKLRCDLENTFEITYLSETPVLSPGPPGSFDDSGVVMGYLITINEQPHLYYLGWNLKVTVPWLNTIGLAQWDPSNRKFKKYSRAPIMDRSDEDPYSISYPSILAENGKYRMWYGSNLMWGKDPRSMQHVIKYAESTDGIHWQRTNKIALTHQHLNEYALSKPWVIYEEGIYKMWYSYRGKGPIDAYRIGYAESSNGLHWIRKDEQAGIDVSPTGWDSEMISYPCVFHYRNKKYMLYNGNGYGKAGFGIAVWV
jgi:hypothetical protein